MYKKSYHHFVQDSIVYLFFDSINTVILYASTVALVSIAFVLTYNASNFPNLYTGATMVYGIYSTYAISQLTNATPYLGAPAGFIISGVFSAAFYWFVIRYMQKRNFDEVKLTISTISLTLVTGALVNIVLYWFIAFRGVYISAVELKVADFALFDIPGVVIMSLLCVILGALLLRRIRAGTRLGAALRGSAENRELAMVCGVNPYKIQVLVWFISGGIVGVAGALYPLGIQGSLYVGISSMFTVVMAAGIFGGLESPSWAILGAFIIVPMQAVVEFVLTRIYGENILPFGRPGDYQWIIPPLFLWITLLLEPGGLRSLYYKLCRRTRWRE
jgi:branched-subunit amino acid ABC-type transport system permease component